LTAMEWLDGQGIAAAAEFRVGVARCGLKQAEGEPDVAVLTSDRPACAAGVFTTNRFAAAPVQWNRALLPSTGIRAVVMNAGNANSCTGSRGRQDVEAEARLAAELVPCEAQDVLVASTGIIGHLLPMERVRRGIRAAWAGLSRGPQADRRAARAIMTTDTREKMVAARVHAPGGAFCIGAMAKGAGMIAPDMATMLCFIATDARVPAGLLDRALRRAAGRTLNRITVDGDSSTNDTALVLANGASGVTVDDGGYGGAFYDALEAVMASLASAIVRNGEGATKLVRVRVSGAVDEQDALRVARAVAESQLVKCAVHGGDPNWGRIICAAGYSGVAVDPDRTSVHIGDVCVLAEGSPTGAEACAAMAEDEVVLTIALGLGGAEAEVLSCDLTCEYVRINAEYHT
jgi:glutamate N-acetyltransferase/amino-acid N-acetyltransferase